MRELRHQLPCNVGLARCTDCVQACTALFPAQRIEVGNLGGMSQVVAEHRDVNVFGKPRDQAERLGERCATFEEEPGPARLQAIEQHVEYPANPEVFSTFCTAVPKRAAAPRNRSRRSSSLAVMTVWNAWFKAGLLMWPWACLSWPVFWRQVADGAFPMPAGDRSQAVRAPGLASTPAACLSRRADPGGSRSHVPGQPATCPACEGWQDVQKKKYLSASTAPVRRAWLDAWPKTVGWERSA